MSAKMESQPTAALRTPVPALLLSDIFPPKVGGSGRWFWEIYKRLPRDQYFIAAGEDSRQAEFDLRHDLNVVDRLPLEFRNRGIRSVRSLKMYWSAAKRVGKLVRQHGIRRLHCARCLPEGLIGRFVKLTCGTPYLCYVHGEEISVAKTSRELTWLARRVFAAADFLIVNSKSTRSMLIEQWGIAPEKLALLYPGVDTARFVPGLVNEPAAQAREIPHPLLERKSPLRTTILTVGRLQRRKGQDMLIRALPAVISKVPDVLYVIVGDGDERKYLEDLARELKVESHVQFIGEATDEQLLECYQRCDLFALPNREVHNDIEGFGMVLVEAQACGKPVLAGMSGGTAETMRVGETGRVVSCDEPGPLADMLIEMLANRERLAVMGQRGREWVCERFDWSILSERARMLFESTIPDAEALRV